MSRNFISVYTVPRCSCLLQPCMQKQSKPPLKYIVPEVEHRCAVDLLKTRRGQSATSFAE